ncbi:MAG: hypothetical protein COA78_17095 [Blastopirellula sp.]|nr:MAG: hypothetical protein COA78_17095 [Blastopirellula sp.]
MCDDTIHFQEFNQELFNRTAGITSMVWNYSKIPGLSSYEQQRLDEAWDIGNELLLSFIRAQHGTPFKPDEMETVRQRELDRKRIEQLCLEYQKERGKR